MIGVSLVHDLAIRSIEWALVLLAGGVLGWAIHEERRDRRRR